MQATTKKRMSTILAIALAVVLSIGGTLAFLASLTEQYENAFSFAENVRARLTEPNWDEDEAKDLIPGYLVRKDPMVTNVSDNGVDVFTAIRVNFTDGKFVELTDAEAARLQRLLIIDWNKADWEIIDGDEDESAEQIWIYKHVLAPGETTNPLFNSVTIKSSWEGDEDTLPGDPDNKLPAWEDEFAWMAKIVMTHTDKCYVYGTCHCTAPITYKHHKECALFKVTGTPNLELIKAAAKGGIVEGKTCDCDPVKDHQVKTETDADGKDVTVTCPEVTGKLDCKDPTHVAAGLNDGFNIVVRAAVVQAGVDGMEEYDDDDTIDNLIALFDPPNQYVAPTTTAPAPTTP